MTKIMDISSGNEFPLKGSLLEIELGHLGGTQSIATTPPHQREPTEVVQASD